MPDTDSTVAQLVSQVLTKQGQQGEQLARIDEQLRQLSNLPDKLRAVELQQASDRGGRDTWSRVISILSIIIAMAAVAAVFIKKGG